MVVFAKIVRGYGSLFGGAARVLALLALCGAIGCAVVLPLWKFATALPAAYTAVVLVLLAAALVYALAKKCRAMGARRALKALLKAFIVCAGLCGCIALVLCGRRLLALAALVAAVVLYGLCSFGAGGHESKA